MAKRRGTHIIELGTHCGEPLGRLLAELCGENVEVLEEVGEFAHALVLGLEEGESGDGTGRGNEGVSQSTHSSSVCISKLLFCIGTRSTYRLASRTYYILCTDIR